MSLSQIIMIAAVFVGVFFSIVLHEIAHALVAYWLGDDTGKRMGRLSLNPLVHIDPIFTIAMPLILLFIAGGAVFGAAKPVPVVSSRMRNPRWDLALVAIAGPVTNLIIAAILALFINLLGLMANLGISPGMTVLLYVLAWTHQVLVINIYLALFNMIPFPPLDGSKIIAVVLPENLWHMVVSTGMMGIIVVLVLIQSGLADGVFAYLSHTTQLIANDMIGFFSFVRGG